MTNEITIGKEDLTLREVRQYFRCTGLLSSGRDCTQERLEPYWRYCPTCGSGLKWRPSATERSQKETNDMGKITDAMHELNTAVLAELNEMSNKHRRALTELAELRTSVEELAKLREQNAALVRTCETGAEMVKDLREAVDEAAEILHNVPTLRLLKHHELQAVNSQIKRAWDSLDGTKR